MLIEGGANSTASFNSDGNLPWFYADQLEPSSSTKMKDILRIGLEMFIKSTHAGHKKKTEQNQVHHQQQQQPHYHDNVVAPQPVIAPPAQPSPVAPPSSNTQQQQHQQPTSFGANQFESLTDIQKKYSEKNYGQGHNDGGHNDRQGHNDGGHNDGQGHNDGGRHGGRESNKQQPYMDDHDDGSSGGGKDYWSTSYNSPFIRDDDRQGTSIWPEAPDFKALNDDDFFAPIRPPPLGHGHPPIGVGNSGQRVSAIGAELRRTNGNSPFDDRQSEDSDSRWEPASLWKGNTPVRTSRYSRQSRYS